MMPAENKEELIKILQQKVKPNQETELTVRIKCKKRKRFDLVNLFFFSTNIY